MFPCARGMTYVFLLLISAFAVCLCTLAQAPTVKLWAVSDGVRVNPVTGDLIESRKDIHKDYPQADVRAGSFIWNATTKTVKLACARNEFIAFQLIIEASPSASEVD